MDKGTAIRAAGRAGGNAIQLVEGPEEPWLIELPDGTLLQEPPTPTYSCRTCRGPIMVSTLSGGWQWTTKPATYEAPWVHMRREDWEDVHQARPVEIEPESLERAEQLASLDILGTDDLADDDERTRRHLAIESPRQGLRFEHARMRSPRRGLRIHELPPEVCRVTRTTRTMVYYRTGDGTANRYMVERVHFGDSVGRVLPDEPVDSTS